MLGNAPGKASGVKPAFLRVLPTARNCSKSVGSARMPARSNMSRL
jgi:hypothetical protein